MRGWSTVKSMVWGTVAAAVVMTAVPSQAELKQVSVGGELRIRGRYYINVFSPRGERVPQDALGWRPLGKRFGTTSIFKWDDDGPDWTRYESSVLLNVKSDFSSDVSTFIEFYDFHIWGEDFRSSYLDGADNRADTSEDMEVNQAYVEVRNTFGAPLTLRVGRQALKYGKGWLVCDMLTPSQYLSYDAFRAIWKPADDLTIDAFASKVAERYLTNPGDEDADFYGVYGTYTGVEVLTMSAYWYYLREALAVQNTQLGVAGEWFESLFGWDDYSATELHTVGAHLFGKSNNWDYELELAYQFGDASHIGADFVPLGGVYGDPGAEYDNWGGEATLGYTFTETPWQPRPYVMGVYFQGHDNRDISFWDWLNPFYRPTAGPSFNRLFSDKNYMPIINDNGWLSNVMQVQAGVELQPTEKIRLHVHVAKDWIDEPFNRPVSWDIGGRRIPIAPLLSFWTEKGSDDLGWEVAAWMKYNYSQDLSFLLYGSYLWAGDGLTDGAFIQFNGTQFNGGTDDDDAAYVFFMALLKF